MEVKKLVCDVCGGQIEMQSGGKGVCTSCGTPYSAEIIKDKIQEIRGIVKVDGPVETVKGDAEKERLLNMANDCLNKGSFDEAQRIYTMVSQEFSNDWRGWWGVICSTPVPQGDYSNAKKGFLDYEFKMALSFAPENQKEMINRYRQQRICEFDQAVSNAKFDKWLKILVSVIYLAAISINVGVPSWSNWWLLLIIPLGGCFLLGVFMRDLGSEKLKSEKQRLATINGSLADNKRKIDALLNSKPN